MNSWGPVCIGKDFLTLPNTHYLSQLPQLRAASQKSKRLYVCICPESDSMWYVCANVYKCVSVHVSMCICLYCIWVFVHMSVCVFDSLGVTFWGNRNPNRPSNNKTKLWSGGGVKSGRHGYQHTSTKCCPLSDKAFIVTYYEQYPTNNEPAYHMWKFQISKFKTWPDLAPFFVRE